MTLPASGTTLVITPSAGNGMALPPWSARGIVETLEPIDQSASIRRACSGASIDMTHAQFRKLTITITCKDVRAPLMNKAWQGQVVSIDCLSERGYLTAGGSPDRTVVPGSSRVEGDYTYYRVRSSFMITKISHGKDEYRADYNWSLQGEEVSAP